jgi:ubiquinone/menaquinone biosynthesis C-methylase UbiE
MAATTGSIVGMTTNVDECRQVYDNWANNYEKDVNEWGYNMPDEVASLLNKHLSTDKQDRDLTILDAGAGDGLSGLALHKYFPSSSSMYQTKTTIIGTDISAQMLQIAKQRGCYSSVQEVDLNKLPLPFEDDTFDAISCVGVMTYVDPTKSLLQEFCRITKPGGYICYTHRTDKMQLFQDEEDRLEFEKYWKSIEKCGPIAYLPNHADFGEKIQAVIYVFQSLKR